MPESSPDYMAVPPVMVDDRRIEIRQKAREIFFRHGFEKTTVADIAEACGLSKAALYHYYSNKEQILVEVVRHESELFLARLRAEVEAASGPREELSAMLVARFQVMGDLVGELLQNKSMDEMERTSARTARLRRHYLEEEIKLLARILDEGQRAGVFVTMDSREAATALMSGFRGMELQIPELRKLPITEDQVRLMLRLLLDGMCRR